MTAGVIKPRLTLDVGDRYGKWTVIEVPDLASGGKIWRSQPLCRCDCGRIKTVGVQSMVDGRSAGCKSCSVKGRNVIHGDSRNGPGYYKRLYRIWVNMIKRCYSSQAINYHQYGAKGIRVTDEWRNDYPTFKRWALANGYADHLTIDRWPDQCGNYEPGNCRWATCKQQGLNTSVNHILAAFGEAKPLTAWADDPRCSVTANTLDARIRRGWSTEWAISAPPRSPKRQEVGV